RAKEDGARRLTNPRRTSTQESPLHLQDRSDGILGLARAVLLVEIKVEGAVADRTRIGGVEIVGKIRLEPWPVGDQVLVVRVEADPLSEHRRGELGFGA